MRHRPGTAAVAAPPLLALALAAATLAACGQRGEETAKAPPTAPAAPAQPAGPLTYASKTADAEVSLTLPPAVGAIPALYGKLFSEGKNELDAFAEGAKGELEELRATGEATHPYGRSLDYAVTADTPHLLSLVQNDLESTGGAHPNTALRAVVWDKQAGKVIEAAGLFAPGADMSTANKALCDAIQAAKIARTQSPKLTGEMKRCPELTGASVAIAASTTPGKAGGLIALFAPYALGPYAEGAYRVVVPAQAVMPVLAPAYAGDFAGAPAPGQDKGPES